MRSTTGSRRRTPARSRSPAAAGPAACGAPAAGRDFTVAPDTDFAAIRQARLDILGDLVAEHLDTEALRSLIEHGPPPGLPVVPPAGLHGLPVL